jgi:type IV pilus assembly protein PilN
MIRINLLAVEREAKKKKATFQAGQKITLACALILVLTVAFVGWRFFALRAESAKIDADIAAAQAETTRLHNIIQQVQQFEQQKAQLQQRVVLIEQLRKSQTGPVHMLDQLSRSLPPMLWLTQVKEGDGGEVQIDGKSTTQTGVSDFVNNLESSGYFKKSIEIVSSQADSTPTPGVDLVRFQLKAMFQTPGETAAPAPAGRGVPAGRGAAPPGGRK